MARVDDKSNRSQLCVCRRHLRILQLFRNTPQIDTNGSRFGRGKRNSRTKCHVYLFKGQFSFSDGTPTPDRRPHEQPRREVAHKPAPARHAEPVKAPPPPPPPAQTVIIEEHHDANPIAVLGCALLGGIIGAIAG